MKLLTILMVGTLTVLSGCVGEDDVDVFLKDPNVTPGKIETLPKTKTFPIADYERSLIKDPFAAQLALSSRSNDNPSSVGAPIAHTTEQLELYPLDSLKMIGFFYMDNVPYALVQDPEMQVHRVKKGAHIGQNYGKVVQITKNGIELKESIQDNAGGWLPSDALIRYQETDQVTSVGGARRTTR